MFPEEYELVRIAFEDKAAELWCYEGKEYAFVGLPLNKYTEVAG